MSHTIFSTSPFRPGGYSQAVVPISSVRTGGLRMGGFFDDALEAIGISPADLDELVGNLDQLIENVPVGVLRESYEKERDACMTKSSVTKYKCLYDLFQKIKDGGQSGATPPPPKRPSPPPDTFPWVPVGIAAGITTAALLYFAFKKK
jgi:hypothetical protein